MRDAEHHPVVVDEEDEPVEEIDEEEPWSLVEDPSDDPRDYYWLDGMAFRVPRWQDDVEE